MKKISLFIATFIAAFSFLALPAQPALAADAKSAICEGIGSVPDGGSLNCTEPAEGSIDNVVARIVGILSLIAGIAAVVMVIISGLKYITSSGDANKVGAAKKTLLYALIGLALAVLTQVIVRAVVTEVTTPPAPNPALHPGGP